MDGLTDKNIYQKTCFNLDILNRENKNDLLTNCEFLELDSAQGHCNITTPYQSSKIMIKENK